MSVNWLLSGVPGIGKTTAVESVMRHLKGMTLAGFITREIRQQDERVGFDIVDTAGRRRALAHVDIPGAQRAGRYGVDISGFESFLEDIPFYSTDIDLIVIDEIGKMECMSRKFRVLVLKLLSRRVPVLATVARFGGGLIRTVKRRSDTILLELHRSNRNTLPEETAREIRIATGHQDA